MVFDLTTKESDLYNCKYGFNLGKDTLVILYKCNPARYQELPIVNRRYSHDDISIYKTFIITNTTRRS